MARLYEIRLKAAALENLKQSREQVRKHLGTTQVGERLTSLSPSDAGDLANSLLSLLDAVDTVCARARATE